MQLILSFSLCIKLFMIDQQQIGFELILRLILVTVSVSVNIRYLNVHANFFNFYIYIAFKSISLKMNLKNTPGGAYSNFCSLFSVNSSEKQYSSSAYCFWDSSHPLLRLSVPVSCCLIADLCIPSAPCVYRIMVLFNDLRTDTGLLRWSRTDSPPKS